MRKKEKSSAMKVYQCPNCHATLKDGNLIWSCDDEHPEVLDQMEQQEGEEEEEDEREKERTKLGIIQGWQQVVQESGDAATNGVATITDQIDVNDTYCVEVAEYVSARALHARTQFGVDSLLQEFGIADVGWHRRER
jgi:hypothetical protein